MIWLLLTLAASLRSPAQGGEGGDFSFRDVTEERGLLPHVAGIRGHAAGWGDVDGDGFLDLYVATFHNEGSKANQFFRNDGGSFVDVSKDNGACPSDLAGRSAAALDYDGDGLLDLLVADDPLPGYKGKRSSRLFKNQGKLAFEDVTQKAGIPEGIPALGVAACDVDLDGKPTTGTQVVYEGDPKGGVNASLLAWKSQEEMVLTVNQSVTAAQDLVVSASGAINGVGGLNAPNLGLDAASLGTSASRVLCAVVRSCRRARRRRSRRR